MQEKKRYQGQNFFWGSRNFCGAPGGSRRLQEAPGPEFFWGSRKFFGAPGGSLKGAPVQRSFKRQQCFLKKLLKALKTDYTSGQNRAAPRRSNLTPRQGNSAPRRARYHGAPPRRAATGASLRWEGQFSSIWMLVPARTEES